MTDRRTDRRTGKTICLLTLKGGDIKRTQGFVLKSLYRSKYNRRSLNQVMIKNELLTENALLSYSQMTVIYFNKGVREYI